MRKNQAGEQNRPVEVESARMRILRREDLCGIIVYMSGLKVSMATHVVKRVAEDILRERAFGVESSSKFFAFCRRCSRSAISFRRSSSVDLVSIEASWSVPIP